MTLESNRQPRESDLGQSQTAPRRRTASTSQATSPTRSPPATASTSATAPPVPTPAQQGTHSSSSSSDDTARQVKQLVGEWSPEISRYGLTSSTTVRDHRIAGFTNSHIARFATPSKPQHNSPESASPSRPNPLHGKRPSDEDVAADLKPPSPVKKARLNPPGTLRLPWPSQPTHSLVPGGVTSPLFFSNSNQHMTGRPPSFSSSEAAAAMLARMRDDQEAVTTVKLPRGTVSSASPARSASTPNSWGSIDAATSRSPDNRALPPQLQQLQGVGVVELIEQDERPTFIVDLANPANFNPGPLHLLFCNASLRASERFHGLLSVDTEDPDFSRFKAWVLSFVKGNESMDVCLPSFSYGGVSWTCLTIRKRYRFVSGNTAAVSMTPTSPSPMATASSVLDERAARPTSSRGPYSPRVRERSHSDVDYFGDVERSSSRRAHSEPRDLSEIRPDEDLIPDDDDDDDDISMDLERTSFDWTRIPISSDLPSHIQFARSIDWASTPLGPIEQWPADLRTMSNMIMGSPHAAAIYWGPEYIAIYNEAYIMLAGQKHPGFMGLSYTVAWAEIWDDIKPVFDNAWNSGQATMKHDDKLFIIRNGFLEETFFNWSIVPLVGGDGNVVAIYNPAFENTKRKVNERRMFTLREVGEKTAMARDVKSFWGQVKKGLEYNEFDIPFALVYSVGEESDSEVSSMHSGSLSNPPQIVLEGSIGVPPNHHAAVPLLDLRTSNEGFATYMRDSMAQTATPIVLSKENGTLPAALVEGLEWRGYGDPCRTVVVFPVHPTTAGESVVGFIVMGTNPRRPYNDDYKLFIHLLSRQLATSMASVVLFEEEIKRGQRAAKLAALDRQELSMQLRLRTQEAVESEYKFTRMAEFVPVGMFIANHEGLINFCNDSWWELSRHPRSADSVDAWMQSIRDEDRPGVEAAWTKLITERIAVTHEFRFKCSREADGHAIDTWVLMSAYPERDADGGLKSIFGCLTDISQQKWAEVFQKQRREEAVELKRQQENFIDITSHEMRNPLSAILQCADEIINGVTNYRTEDPSSYVPGNLNVLLDSALEAANTISLCASHQKRIVDDILTLSKLDSQLLYVTPVDVQPVAVIETVLKMFESELNSNSIRGEFRIDPSFQELNINWAKLDPSRLRQVLINLMTNAIKFTQSRENRSIVITLGASRRISEASVAGLSYFPTRQDSEDITNKPEWGQGEKINLHVAVTDTGPGLDENERVILFQRFSQASPRTHVQYGGSGLGLFISRILTELQGGQIGVQSEKGVGSTFAFYIKSRKVELPQLSPTTIVPPPVSPYKITATQTLQYTTSRSGSDAASPQLSQRKNSQNVSPISARDPHAPPPLDVLIVEDNIVNQTVLQRQLRKSGNNTYVANHGGEALEAIRRSRFWSSPTALTRSRRSHSSGSSKASASDSGSEESESEKNTENINISVILMDLEMPVMDGMTCARKIRQLERAGTINRHIPIIAVTAYARPEQIENAKAAGVDDVISKPFRIPELIPKIEELVAKYQTHTISP